MQRLGNRLEFLAKNLGGQRPLAKKSKVGEGLIGRYIKGRVEPGFEKMISISNATGVSLDWLATGEGLMRPGEEVAPSSAWEKEKEALGAKVELLKEMAVLKQTTKQPPSAWEQGKAELEEKAPVYRRLQEHLEAGKREIELLKGQIEAGKREVEAGKREIELLKEVAALKEMKQLPPPPIAGGGFADITLLGLAECGFAGWLLKKPLSVNVICPVGMNPAEDFAVMATGQSLFYAGIEPGFVCFCAAKSAPLVGDIVYVLKPSNKASLGLVRELKHKEKGSKTSWLVLQKWHDLDPKTGLREPYTLRENRDEIVEIVPVIYVQRRPI